MKTLFGLCLRHQTTGALSFVDVRVEIVGQDIAPQVVNEAIDRALQTLNLTDQSVHHIRRVPYSDQPVA